MTNVLHKFICVVEDFSLRERIFNSPFNFNVDHYGNPKNQRLSLPTIILKHEYLNCDIFRDVINPDVLGLYSSEDNSISLSTKAIPFCADQYYNRARRTIDYDNIVRKLYDVVLVHELIHWLMLTEIDLDWQTGKQRATSDSQSNYSETGETEEVHIIYDTCKNASVYINKLASPFNIRKHSSNSNKIEEHKFFNENLAQLGTYLFLKDTVDLADRNEYFELFNWLANGSQIEYHTSEYHVIMDELGVSSFKLFLAYLALLRTANPNDLFSSYKNIECIGLLAKPIFEFPYRDTVVEEKYKNVRSGAWAEFLIENWNLLYIELNGKYSFLLTIEELCYLTKVGLWA